jgi:hypothetical protein
MRRFRLQEAVTVRYWDGGMREVPATVENASPDGICLETSDNVPRDRHLEVVFTLPPTLRSAGVRFACRCRVVRSTRVGHKLRIAAVILRTESERMSTAAEPAKELPCPGLAMAD